MTIPIDLFLHPNDKAPFACLGSPRDVVGKAGFWSSQIDIWNHEFLRHYNLTGKIKVDEHCKQYRKQRELLIQVCEKIGISTPEFYVKIVPNSEIETYGDKIPHIIISSFLINKLSDKELQAVFARECGHVLCRHTRWLSLEKAFEGRLKRYSELAMSLFTIAGLGFAKSSKILSSGAWVLDGLSALFRFKIGDYIAKKFEASRRAGAYTADRVAAYVMNDAKIVVRAIALANGGDDRMVDALLALSEKQIHEAELSHDAEDSEFHDAIDGFVTSNKAGNDVIVDRVADLTKWFVKNHEKFPPYCSRRRGHFSWLDK